MLATAGADRSDFDSKLCTPHDAHACRVSAARDQQRARKSFVSSNQFDFNIIILNRNSKIFTIFHYLEIANSGRSLFGYLSRLSITEVC